MSPSLEPSKGSRAAREVKFLLTPALAEAVRQWARHRLQPDPHGCGPNSDIYRISSLYLDTAKFDVYARNRSFGRAKFRIRRYEEAKRAFLERKLKTDGMVRKQRSLVHIQELERLEDATASRDWVGRWFHRRVALRGLRAVCQISYLRTARFGRDASGTVRLTIDQDLRALPVRAFAFTEFKDGLPIAGENAVLEMKFRGDMPADFALLTREFGLAPLPLSKYRLAAAALQLAPATSAAPGSKPATPLH
jgi:hypothetical protein